MKLSLLSAIGAIALPVCSAASDLFPFEADQLISADLSQLNTSLQALFGSENNTSAVSKRSASCKTFPGDLLWPSQPLWDIFGLLVNNKLIKAVPIGAPCHNGPHYDSARCNFLINNWSNSDIHELDPTSMMSPLYEGLTCIQTTDPTLPCTQGGYPVYVVNATTVAHVQLAVNLARSLNIRLVVKNTGHDFQGKSGGAGALSIWTHNFKDIQYIPAYSGSGYKGPAFKAGSGVIAKEIYAAAQQHGLEVVGGEGATVGVFGGYIQGGGHSPLANLHGMGADQVLAYEVVTADGSFVTASSTQNSDLFWALRGGGGGTFGVVTSVTVKAFPTTKVTVVTFAFAIGGTVTADNFWKGVRAYFDYFIKFTDAGAYSYFFILPFGTTTFSMQPFFAPGLDSAQTLALLNPWFQTLSSLGIQITPVTQTFDNFHDAWAYGFPQEAVGQSAGITGSRLFPRSFWASNSTLDTVFAAWKSSSDLGFMLISFNFAPTLARGGNPDNAVLPAWRDTLMHSIQGVNWADGANATTLKAARAALTSQQNLWKSIGTDGAYLGEADIEDPDFQTSFYGKNYPKLLSIKKKYDPKNVFWVKTGVGSEVYTVKSTDPIPSENGKLCST